MTEELVVRKAVPGDVPGIEAMHSACSLDSRIARWHAPLRAVPSKYLADAVSGRREHVALVATDGRDVIALASAVHVGGGSWDLGVLVRDDRQRQGLGTSLVTAVVTEAVRRGATGLRADLTPSRHFLLAVLQPLGRVLASVDGDGLHARVELSATPATDRTTRFIRPLRVGSVLREPDGTAPR